LTSLILLAVALLEQAFLEADRHGRAAKEADNVKNEVAFGPDLRARQDFQQLLQRYSP